MPKSFIGDYTVSLGLRNNNPGNLRPSGDKWQGMIGVYQGFLVFSDIYEGLRALGKDLTTKINRGLNTIAKLITVYAPPQENDTPAYINTVSHISGIGRNQEITADYYTLSQLIRGIIYVENGPDDSDLITDDDIAQGLNLINNKITAGTTGTAFLLTLISLGYTFRKELFS